MKYFMDTEFIDDGKTIDLISIGIVCEDGRELYMQSSEFNIDKASSWVRENVIMHLDPCPYIYIPDHSLYSLGTLYGAQSQHKQGQCLDQQYGLRHRCPWRTREQLRRGIQYFFNPSDGIELWGWCAGYDFVAFCQLFGTMMDLPKGWPHYIRDFQQVLDERQSPLTGARGISDEELPPQEEGLHNSLADAHHLKRLWGYIVRNDAWQ